MAYPRSPSSLSQHYSQHTHHFLSSYHCLPDASSSWFKFPIEQTRELFFQGMTCTFCLQSFRSFDIKQSLTHVTKCAPIPFRYDIRGEKSQVLKVSEVLNVFIFENRSWICNPKFQKAFLTSHLQIFRLRLNKSRVQQDRLIHLIDPDEYSTVNDDFRQATILVDHLSEEVTDFISSSVKLKRFLDEFGFYRLRPRDLQFASASEYDICQMDIKKETLQVFHPLDGHSMNSFTVSQFPSTKRYRKLSAFFRGGRLNSEFRLLTSPLISSDADYLQFIQSANSESTALRYGIGLPNLVPRITYHHLQNITKDPLNVLNRLKTRCTGISTPLGYAGLAGTTFALHTVSAFSVHCSLSVQIL